MWVDFLERRRVKAIIQQQKTSPLLHQTNFIYSTEGEGEHMRWKWQPVAYHYAYDMFAITESKALFRRTLNIHVVPHTSKTILITRRSA